MLSLLCTCAFPLDLKSNYFLKSFFFQLNKLRHCVKHIDTCSACMWARVRVCSDGDSARAPHWLSRFLHSAEEYSDTASGAPSCPPASSQPRAVAAVHFLSPVAVAPSTPTSLTQTDMVSIESTSVCETVPAEIVVIWVDVSEVFFSLC